MLTTFQYGFIGFLFIVVSAVLGQFGIYGLCIGAGVIAFLLLFVCFLRADEL